MVFFVAAYCGKTISFVEHDSSFSLQPHRI